jgi:hypothetical protein
MAEVEAYRFLFVFLSLSSQSTAREFRLWVALPMRVALGANLPKRPSAV